MESVRYFRRNYLIWGCLGLRTTYILGNPEPQLEILVQWRDYPPTWEPAVNVFVDAPIAALNLFVSLYDQYYD